MSENETPTEELLRYLRFDAAHGARIAALRPHVQPHFERIAQLFYERIREHEDAHAVLRDEAQVLRLQRSLIRWLGELFDGRYDAAHFKGTAHVGEVHVLVGLPQRYMPLAMALVRSELVRLVVAGLGAAAAEPVQSLDLLIDLELTVMLESFRRHVEERLRALATTAGQPGEARRSALAIELANVVIVGTDAEGRVVLFNREAERITGWARDECMGKDALALLFDDDTRARVREAVRGAAAGRDVTFPADLMTRAKKVRDVRWQVVCTPEGGADVFFVGSDVTDEVQRSERTHRAERLAAVGMLAAGLAHEIRNPLNGARLHATFLERSLKKAGGAPELLDAVRTIDAELVRLSDLVTEFLHFARPQSMTRRPAPLAEIVGRAHALLLADAERAGVTLGVELPEQPIVALCDADKIGQVLLNLGKNAIEAFAKDAPGHVVLRLRRTPRRAIVSVEDDGPGLPSPDAPIFDAFFSTKPGGTGLGLPIAHRIVTDHDGALTVTSEPGRTAFTVDLPIAEPT